MPLKILKNKDVNQKESRNEDKTNKGTEERPKIESGRMSSRRKSRGGPNDENDPSKLPQTNQQTPSELSSTAPDSSLINDTPEPAKTIADDLANESAEASPSSRGQRVRKPSRKIVEVEAQKKEEIRKKEQRKSVKEEEAQGKEETANQQPPTEPGLINGTSSKTDNTSVEASAKTITDDLADESVEASPSSRGQRVRKQTRKIIEVEAQKNEEIRRKEQRRSLKEEEASRKEEAANAKEEEAAELKKRGEAESKTPNIEKQLPNKPTKASKPDVEKNSEVNGAFSNGAKNLKHSNLIKDVNDKKRRSVSFKEIEVVEKDFSDGDLEKAGIDVQNDRKAEDQREEASIKKRRKSSLKAKEPLEVDDLVQTASPTPKTSTVGADKKRKSIQPPEVEVPKASTSPSKCAVDPKPTNAKRRKSNETKDSLVSKETVTSPKNVGDDVENKIDGAKKRRKSAPVSRALETNEETTVAEKEELPENAADVSIDANDDAPDDEGDDQGVTPAKKARRSTSAIKPARYKDDDDDDDEDYVNKKVHRAVKKAQRRSAPVKPTRFYDDEAPFGETEDEAVDRLIRSARITLISGSGVEGGERGAGYECGECQKQFFSKTILVNHVKTHEGDRRFVCDVCGKGFNQSSTLSRHRAVHSSDKPFECKHCDAAFNRSSTLRAHMKTHDTVKRFKCPICNKGFHQKGNLKNHVFTHTGERPYQCTLCESGFNQATNLRNHLATNHGIVNTTCRICQDELETREKLMKHMEVVHDMAYKESTISKMTRKTPKASATKKSKAPSTASRVSSRRISSGFKTFFNEDDDEASNASSASTIRGIESPSDAAFASYYNPHAEDLSTILVLHRGVIKFASLNRDDQEALDSIDVKMPFGQTSLKIPVVVNGVQVPNPDMMYKVKLQSWSHHEKVTSSKREVQETEEEETAEEEEEDYKVTTDGVEKENIARENPFLADDDDEYATSMMSTNFVSPVEVDLTTAEAKDDDEEEEAAEIPPLQPMETYVVKEEPTEEEEEDRSSPICYNNLKYGSEADGFGRGSTWNMSIVSL